MAVRRPHLPASAAPLNSSAAFASAHGLTAAVVAASHAPSLLLDRELKVTAASASFNRTFQLKPNTIIGRPLNEMGAGEWSAPELRSLLAATASGDVEVESFVMDLQRSGRPPRHLVINARRLQYADPVGKGAGEAVNAYVLVSVVDITEAWVSDQHKDHLLREKAVLLQEVRHRVANSLQIIASLLLQSAREVQLEETRRYLNDAHSRVMSIATVQRQLASSTLGTVPLRAYFTDLCKGLGASMIGDADHLSIEVKVDDSVVDADVSVSLGLLVTELVINALKHAFPDRRKGKIIVSYHSKNEAWTLKVQDDGIGHAQAIGGARTGLGTSIVQALAHQLNARVDIGDGPGTAVSIIHG